MQYTLWSALSARPRRLLQATAAAHGLSFNTRRPKQGEMARLHANLTAQGHLARLFRALTAQEREPLRALQSAGGSMSLPDFCSLFGMIRSYKPWRAGAPRQPWKRPVSVAEKLWYLAFVEVVRGQPDQVVVPIEVLALLPPLSRPLPPLPVPEEVGDRLLRDLAAFLGALLALDTRPLHHRWLPPCALRAINARLAQPDPLSGVRSELQTRRLKLLHYLLEAGGLVSVQAGKLLPTVEAWTWLERIRVLTLKAEGFSWRVPAKRDPARSEAIWRDQKVKIGLPQASVTPKNVRKCDQNGPARESIRLGRICAIQSDLC